MKRSMRVVFAATILLLAGCTTPHATKWEYKVVAAPSLPHAGAREQYEADQALLNDLGKDGWSLVSQSEGRLFYFKRAVR